MSKNRKIRNYIFIALMVLINAFIIFEASLPGGLSSLHSGIFSDWFEGIINSNVSVSQEIVKLDSIELKNASFEPDNKIVLGTTEKLQSILLPENVSDNSIKYEVQPQGVLNLVPDASGVWVEATGKVGQTALITATSNDKSTNYTFEIIDREIPDEFEIINTDINLSLNMSEAIDVKLLKLDHPYESRRQDQSYLIRYYDPLKLNFTSSDPNVAIIQHGYVVAKGIGDCKISISNGNDISKEINVHVQENSNPIIVPTDFDLSFEGQLHVYDLDHVNTHKDEVGGKINVNFKESGIYDHNIYYQCLTPLTGIVNQTGITYGYKTAGEVKIKATSIANPSLSKIISLNSSEVVATDMEINIVGKPDLVVGQNLSINATFTPFNTTNENLIVTVDNPDVAKATAVGKSIAISALDEGKVKISVKSVSNPSLVKEIELTFTKKLAINDDNKSEFNTFVRKALGHFLLFFANGVITMLCFVFLRQEKDWYKVGKPLLISSFVGFGIAWLSEFIQIFVKRGASISDVMLDFSGFFAAALIITIIFAIINVVSHKHKKEANDEENK